jgi:hypothetical protein
MLPRERGVNQIPEVLFGRLILQERVGHPVFPPGDLGCKAHTSTVPSKQASFVLFV